MKETFRKSERIRKRGDFLTIQHEGRRLSSPHFTLLLYPRESGLNRLGITASRRVGGAVKRNRIKRLLREYFRRNKSSFCGPCDILIIVKKMSQKLTFQEVQEEIDKILRYKVDAR